ncbi:MAG: electron transport complex subunit RsxC [Deltaproteobacteria bacterium]|nr:electron transport complex subunit RsxC [Deltaproteobacteria bacterium]
MKKSATFPRGGIHPKEEKHLTKNLPVEVMPLPARVSLFLKQHIGEPCAFAVKKKQLPPINEEFLFTARHPGAIYQLLVNKKERVSEGELIGSIGKKLGANLHASVDGTVEGVMDVPHPIEGKAPAIVLATDPEAKPAVYSSIDWTRLSREELVAKITNAGIVGLGGAGFPTHAKVAIKPDVKMETLILNGAECEPYLTCDHRIMVEHGDEVVEGAMILLTVLGIDSCVIGVEDNKPDAVQALKTAISQNSSSPGFKITVQPLRVKYPQGAAKQLIQSITGKQVPQFGRSLDVGVIIQNVGTTRAVYQAVVLGKPLYEKTITISGRGIGRPANLQVKIGTSLTDIVNYLGGVKPNLARVVVGGPMMGAAVSSLDIPITKTTSGVIFLARDEIDTRDYGPCIRCGFCLDACPMGVEPNMIGLYLEAGRWNETEQFGMNACIECGSCAFVCPAKRPLVQFVKLAKLKHRFAQRESKKKQP